ncbi:MAG: hypothetical protein HW380_847 [Magnetococcales bacterium]|nr:hypothetical protein [Magnetococcales bacterium]
MAKLGSSVGFPQDDGDLEHCGDRIGKQQLGTVADDTAPLLLNAGQKSRNVHQIDDGNVESVAKTDEPGTFVRSVDIIALRRLRNASRALSCIATSLTVARAAAHRASPDKSPKINPSYKAKATQEKTSTRAQPTLSFWLKPIPKIAPKGNEKIQSHALFLTFHAPKPHEERKKSWAGQEGTMVGKCSV